MIYRTLTGFFCLFLLSAQAQVLRDVNYNYRYDPNGPFNFSWKVVKLHEGYQVFYEIFRSDTTQELKNLNVQFETRESIIEKNGTIISSRSISTQTGIIAGSVNFPVAQDQNI